MATINFQTAQIVVNDDSLREVRNLMSAKLGPFSNKVESFLVTLLSLGKVFLS